MKFFKLTDIILIVVLLATAFFAHRAFSGGSQALAQISVDGNIVEEIDLSSIKEAYIIQYNNVSIEVCPQKICFVQSNCSDKTCVRGGWLSEAGDFSACLPNKVAIRILGAQAPDAITG